MSNEVLRKLKIDNYGWVFDEIFLHTSYIIMEEYTMLEIHASIGQTHQSRPGSMVFPQFTKIPVTLVFNKTNSLGE